MNKIEELAEKMTMAQKTLSVAESCTGGLLCHHITNMPGSSSFFEGGVVAYSNVAKIEVIAVPLDCLRNHGPVSERTALAMANGAREAFSSDVGISITGIAGPGTDAGTNIGQVFISISEDDEEIVEEFKFEGDREAIKKQAAEKAVEMCIKYLDEH